MILLNDSWASEVTWSWHCHLLGEFVWHNISSLQSPITLIFSFKPQNNLVKYTGAQVLFSPESCLKFYSTCAVGQGKAQYQPWVKLGQFQPLLNGFYPGARLPTQQDIIEIGIRCLSLLKMRHMWAGTTTWGFMRMYRIAEVRVPSVGKRKEDHVISVCISHWPFLG